MARKLIPENLRVGKCVACSKRICYGFERENQREATVADCGILIIACVRRARGGLATMAGAPGREGERRPFALTQSRGSLG